MNTIINDRMPDQMLDLYHLLLAEFGPQYWWPAETEFEVIVGALLTQQTRWESVEHAIANLKDRSLLTPEALADANQETIEECIRCTGFYRQKAERLQLLSQYFDHNGITEILKRPVAELRRELLSLKGVGPETADSIILYAAHKPIFVIDAYTKKDLRVHRSYRRIRDAAKTVRGLATTGHASLPGVSCTDSCVRKTVLHQEAVQ